MSDNFREIPPDPSKAVESLRNFGYTFEQAVADLVDNSIAANSTKIKINFLRTYDEDLEFKILDNGDGIKGEEEIVDVLKYGSEDKDTNFNQFGLGLKTASTSQCKRLTVISKSKNGFIKGVLNIDIIKDRKKWVYEITENITEEESLPFEHMKSGTLVIWDKFDKLKIGKSAKAFSNKIIKLEHHLAITFQRFLDVNIETAINGVSTNVEIELNENKINPFDPFLVTNQNTDLIVDKTLSVPEVQNRNLKFKGYSLPRFNSFASKTEMEYARVRKAEYQGYYIYREDRLVVFGSWLEKYSQEPHYSLCRIGIFINRDLDDVIASNVMKNKFTFKDDELFQNILEHTIPVRKAAQTKYREGNKKVINDKSKNAHESSSKIITSKESELNDFSDATYDEASQKVTFNNHFGKFIAKYKFTPPKNSNEINIETVDSLEDGILFEPKFVNSEETDRTQICALLNTNHDYYRKVIFPNHNNENFINYFDAIIWAFCNAELKTYSDSAKENYRELRVDISRSLRVLVEDFPEPKIDEDFSALNDNINNAGEN